MLNDWIQGILATIILTAAAFLAIKAIARVWHNTSNKQSQSYCTGCAFQGHCNREKNNFVKKCDDKVAQNKKTP